MNLTYDLIQKLQSETPSNAWKLVFDHAWEICTKPLAGQKIEGEIVRRDRALADLDLYLATAGWDLWSQYETSVPQTAEVLAEWWKQKPGARAVLILDALSLRETPWLLAGAEARGFSVVSARTTGAELPPDTTPFAKALGFAQRSALGNNGAGGSHRLAGARTETTDVDWQSCAAMIGAEPNWVFWHHWPDKDVHDFADAGEGLRPLVQKAEEHLTGDSFWSLVSRLAEGRSLVITSDHGYAASELFPDASPEQADYLKKLYSSGRCSTAMQDAGSWVPPIDLSLNTRFGKHLFVNGRRKWKSAGGYPTLTHGGLSVLEVAVPFLELTKKGGV
jgi:hypothetical protein